MEDETDDEQEGKHIAERILVEREDEASAPDRPWRIRLVPEALRIPILLLLFFELLRFRLSLEVEAGGKTYEEQQLEKNRFPVHKRRLQKKRRPEILNNGNRRLPVILLLVIILLLSGRHLPEDQRDHEQSKPYDAQPIFTKNASHMLPAEFPAGPDLRHRVSIRPHGGKGPPVYQDPHMRRLQSSGRKGE
jgi:hypothetical protein